jgi:hypothetical protein
MKQCTGHGILVWYGRFRGRKEEHMSKLKLDRTATSKTDLNMEKGTQMIRNDCQLNVPDLIHIRIECKHRNNSNYSD